CRPRARLPDDAPLLHELHAPDAGGAALLELEPHLDAVVLGLQAQPRSCAAAARSGHAHVAAAAVIRQRGRRGDDERGEADGESSKHEKSVRSPRAGRNGTLVPLHGARSSRSPWRSAHRTAWTRSVTPICRKMLVRCDFTVFSLMSSRRAISLFGI